MPYFSDTKDWIAGSESAGAAVLSATAFGLCSSGIIFLRFFAPRDALKTKQAGKLAEVGEPINAITF